ncbi:unnamed protein product [Ilex paraguariensis]|uniref:Fe2OG dioxygenase domain-containing protein n=1 Tax=Ilex paraguariensis TaxID=185542 RepID=A0ABC8U4X3_9AQUA
MATTAPTTTQLPPTSDVQPSKMTSIKTLAKSPDLKTIPSNYAYSTNPDETTASDQEVSVPIIDFSLLTSGTPEQRSKAIQDLNKACQDWGFFMVVNHGVPEALMKAMINASDEFFNLSKEEKQEFAGKYVLDPIRCGTSFNPSKEKVFFWRDFLKVIVHPEFHFPNKPIGFSELSSEYCKRTRKVARELLKGISESLGVDNNYMEKTLNLDSGLQIFILNLYPPCPQPELAMGLPPHSDHGLLTLLIQNEVPGLQVQHNGKWVTVNPLPNSFLVNTADHLEIFSNGKYKSVVHRAVVNNRLTRMSLAMAHGPSLETTVSPASNLLDSENNPPAYIPMKYKQYLELQQGNQLDRKSCLGRVRVRVQSE